MLQHSRLEKSYVEHNKRVDVGLILFSDPQQAQETNKSVVYWYRFWNKPIRVFITKKTKKIRNRVKFQKPD